MDRRGWDERYASAELVWSAEPNRFLVAELADLPPGRALDLAAGEGRNAVWLAGRGWHVTAVDFSLAGLGTARRLAARRGAEVEWIVADLLAWQPPAAAFDLVALIYLHLQQPPMERVLAGASAALTPGGTLLVVGHDRANLEHGHGGPQDPTVLYTAAEIAALLPDLDIRTAEQRRRDVSNDHGSATALDCVVRAVRPTMR